MENTYSSIRVQTPMTTNPNLETTNYIEDQIQSLEKDFVGIEQSEIEIYWLGSWNIDRHIRPWNTFTQKGLDRFLQVMDGAVKRCKDVNTNYNLYQRLYKLRTDQVNQLIKVIKAQEEKIESLEKKSKG